MNVDDLPIATEFRLGRAPVKFRATRRGFLKSSGVVLTTAGLYALGVLRFAPRAYASLPPFHTVPTCDPYGYLGVGKCDGKGAKGCVGSEDNNLYTDNSYCTTCDEARQSACLSNWYQYFLNGTSGSVTLADRDSNICTSAFYDDWEHIPSPTACGYCPTTIWRCHDGWKTNSTGVHATICHGLVKCGTALTPVCPASC